MQQLVIGNVDGEPIIYESPEVDIAILSALMKILTSTLISVGLKALCDLVLSKDFSLKYPGGRLRLSPKVSAVLDDCGSCDFMVSIRNSTEE